MYTHTAYSVRTWVLLDVTDLGYRARTLERRAVRWARSGGWLIDGPRTCCMYIIAVMYLRTQGSCSIYIHIEKPGELARDG